MSNDQVFVFSPPKRKGQREVNPSEFLLLKPFSKAPSLQIDVGAPGESKTATLTVQNIDDNPSRLYFEIPAEKKIAIRPGTAIIQPQSVEMFEVIALEPKESFRATIKIFAPDIKYYKGGQFSVYVNVKKVLKTEKKKKKSKPALPVAKPKAVTVPEEFVFQPSREARKKMASGDKTEEGDNDFRTEALDLGSGVVEVPSTDLARLQRRTAAFKQNLVANQTYSVLPPTIVPLDFNDPITFVKHQLGTSCSLDDVTRAVMKYAEHARALGLGSTSITDHRRQVMNAVMIENRESLAHGNLSAVMTQLRDVLRLESSKANFHQGLINEFSNTRISEESQASRPPTRTTSSPKRDEAPREITRKVQNRYDSYLCESLATISDTLPPSIGSYNNSSMKEVTSPDVSAIFSASHFN